MQATIHLAKLGVSSLGQLRLALAKSMGSG
jgi:hypothetical protein